MDSQRIDRSAFDTFAKKCEVRGMATAEILRNIGTGAETLENGLEALSIHLNDTIGEARLLGFSDLSRVANILNQLLVRDGDQLRREAVRQRIASWVEQLHAVATLNASSLGDVGQAELLDNLEQELERALGKNKSDGTEELSTEMRRVLVFDDSSVVGYVLECHLSALGFAAVSVETIDQFNQRLAAGFEPDVLLLDINMPGMRGDEVCRQLRKRPDTEHLQIILMSGLRDDELATLAQEAGADGYLSKQHGMDKLMAYVERFLRSLDNDARKSRSAIDGADSDPVGNRSFSVGASISDALKAAAAAIPTDAD